MSATLAAIALNAGLPIIEKILSRRLGDHGGELAMQVIASIADSLKTTPDQIEVIAENQPGAVIDAMREVERMTPELVALYAAGLEGQFALMQVEAKDPAWVSAWRPAGMWIILFLWVWNIVILHVANAIWKIALPPAPYDALGWLTGVYCSLYMGGHTIKDVIGKWVAK